MTPLRKKIPEKTEAEVLFLSDRLCCVDQKRGDHIHHIDGNNSNNAIDNLVLLCFDCHNEASISGSLRKKLTPAAIRKYRDFHYSRIEHKRLTTIQDLNSDLKKITSNDLVDSALTAITLFELSKIKAEYFNIVSIDRDSILQKILKLTEFNNARVSFEVFTFLTKVAYETRSGIPTKMIDTICHIIFDFFPPKDILSDKKKLLEIGSQCSSIGYILVYDSLIHWKNYKVTSIGFLILKYVYKEAKYLKVKKLLTNIQNTYTELRSQLNRPERNDLEPAKELLKLNFIDLEEESITLPKIPSELQKVLELSIQLEDYS